MPVAVVKRKLMLADVWLTDSAFIKQCCTGQEIGRLMGPNLNTATATGIAAVQHFRAA